METDRETTRYRYYRPSAFIIPRPSTGVKQFCDLCVCQSVPFDQSTGPCCRRHRFRDPKFRRIRWVAARARGISFPRDALRIIMHRAQQACAQRCQNGSNVFLVALSSYRSHVKQRYCSSSPVSMGDDHASHFDQLSLLLSAGWLGR